MIQSGGFLGSLLNKLVKTDLAIPAWLSKQYSFKCSFECNK